MESFDNALDQYLNNLKEKGETSVTPSMDNVIKPAEEKSSDYFEEDEEVFSVEADNEDYPLEDFVNKDEIEYVDDFIKETEEEKIQENKFREGEEVLQSSDNENEEPGDSENTKEEEKADEEESSEENIEDDEDNNDDENEDENNFEEAGEEDLLDVNDPLLYTDNDTDSISFDDLNESNDGNSEDDEFAAEPKAKQSFKSLNNNLKKKFEPGRLNKNNMMIAILGFLFIVFAGFIWANRSQEKKKNAVNEDEEYLSIDGYKPDFGDYKSRVYKQENIPGNEEASEKINQILFEGEKEKYENPSKENENKGQTGYYGNNNQNVSSNQSTGGNPANDLYRERVESGLRKNINGYSDYNYSGGNGFNIGGQGTPVYSTSNSGNYAQEYFDQLNSISGALGDGKNSNSSNQSASLRFSDGGRYDKNASGGDISYIPENSIYPGTIIHAVLVSGINTDYPGAITARVINNVYDSRTGKTLLIPSGSILRGSYSSSSIGISRIQIAWQTLIINRNGVDYSVNLGSMVGVDSKGFSGIKGSLNDHEFAYLKAAGISCLFTFINSNIFSVTQKQKNRTTQQMISDSQDIGNKLADKILDRALDIQPTVTVKNGTRISVDVDKILTLYPFERDMPQQKYKR